jgi:integrase
MTRKFNPKQYQGKPRIYVAIPCETKISRLWIWDEKAKEYRVPPLGKCYLTNRYEEVPGEGRKRIFRFFEAIEDARSWQRGMETGETPASVLDEKPTRTGPLFKDVVEEWKRRSFPRLKLSTKISYENLLRLFFGELQDCTIHEITPQKIDAWLDKLKSPEDWIMQSKKRTTFKNELKLLATILNYYGDYYDEDADFRFPKDRHRKAARLNRQKARPKDLKEEEFFLFREALRTLNGKGEMLATLATVQYYQALRISEAAAIHWQDIFLDPKIPSWSRIKVARLVVWPRKKELSSHIQNGFKNAGSNDGVKEQPMFPETFEAFRKMHYKGAHGLVFHVDGRHLEYRAIQSAYDRAFKKENLPYRGTHVMRHGGCRRVYNEGGDLAVAQQLLGNSDLKSTLVYAKRSASALTEVAQKHWAKKNEVDCKRLQKTSS